MSRRIKGDIMSPFKILCKVGEKMNESYLKIIENSVNEIFKLLKNPYVTLDINKIDMELILCDMKKLIEEIKKLRKIRDK